MSEWLQLYDHELMAAARAARDRRYGRTVTYSPKVFIPLTKLCRDRCGYCTFAQPLARVPAPYLSRDEVLAVAGAGADAGCTEALFTMGERPELRYPEAAQWLHSRGYRSTVHYAAAMCREVLTETGLLPHANLGALQEHELAELRPVTASQGMMLETLRSDLACHASAPDKTPWRRLATLEAAGSLRIPFTTGVLIGIGEQGADWQDALVAIGASHERHGHVGEVIVQNFLPKEGTAMRKASAAVGQDHRRAIALARMLLPADVTVQAPPNLSADVGALLDAGVNDLGGISPVTIDHVNPERPWPHLDRLHEQCQAKGFELRARLPVYDAHCSGNWLADDVLDAIGAIGITRRGKLAQ